MYCDAGRVPLLAGEAPDCAKKIAAPLYRKQRAVLRSRLEAVVAEAQRGSREGATGTSSARLAPGRGGEPAVAHGREGPSGVGT